MSKLLTREELTHIRQQHERHPSAVLAGMDIERVVATALHFAAVVERVRAVLLYCCEEHYDRMAAADCAHADYGRASHVAKAEAFKEIADDLQSALKTE
jgi:hypothetical protein